MKEELLATVSTKAVAAIVIVVLRRIAAVAVWEFFWVVTKEKEE